MYFVGSKAESRGKDAVDGRVVAQGESAPRRREAEDGHDPRHGPPLLHLLPKRLNIFLKMINFMFLGSTCLCNVARESLRGPRGPREAPSPAPRLLRRHRRSHRIRLHPY